MNMRILAPGLLALVLTACNNAPPPPTPPEAPGAPAGTAQTAIGRTVEKAMAEARQKLASENISLNSTDGGVHIGRHAIGNHDPNLPKAEITPQGDFLVDGKTVTIDDGQRKLLLDYRGHIIDIAGTGMSIGAKGADFGIRAAGEAVKGIFTGNADEVGKRIEAEAETLKADVVLICKQLPALLATQDALASSLPEFKPYAKMEQTDIDDCASEVGKRTGDLAGLQSEIRDDIRNDIRNGIRQSVRGSAPAVAAPTGSGSTANVDGVRFLLPAGAVSVETIDGRSTLAAGDDLKVVLERDALRVNGTRYGRPAKGSEIDLRGGGVRVDGKPATTAR